ncbi:Alpha/Beta hydrolase protein [Mycena metata]|uniref:Alpha/Beta hydrolase protein n=1 Tax=Mycena metata TaxID=1033252 RepID=A0AAD7ICE1_9AGAR|nr:Alpha/Beta hydrolase protein [Mycena metata]
MLVSSSFQVGRSFARRSALRLNSKPLTRTVATSRTKTPIDLHFTSQIPADNKTSGAIVILHGLFGSSRNWGAHSRTFARNLQRPIYALDLRNHGSSEHAQPMTYSAMAADVIHFIQQHSLSDVSLIGHSMGGKVAMTVALESSLPASTLFKLIVVDIAPARGELSDEFKGYISAMKKIEAAKLSNRKEALEILNEYEKNPDVCAFLLTNLIQKPNESHFRIPVNLIGESIAEMGSFPFTPEETQWTGETLFIKGSRSSYINRHNIPLAEKFFPEIKLENLDTNHWVHSEKPNEFSTLVENFIGPLV